ncbi:ABC transporter substrate-binding protein [Leucobacter denitrificans]|uniref:ABC transporter substrate-binding protein n=1 Tax=Leucobacter denitrificans TaxID=683042 RepID=A0A7G9S7S6_9MICO|nr:ABC transporter substrate-binding protein [Leucobacter denitrificans]
MLAVASLATAAALALSACSSSTEAAEEGEPAAATSVTITDNHGEVEVPVNPETVVALDNHVYQTLSDWDVELAAAPKGLMGTLWPEYRENDDVFDVGTHREPDLEQIVAAQPDLIIGGGRFGGSYDDIKAQNPQAVVIELAPRDGEDLVEELKRMSTALGEIFDHADEAQALNDDLDAAIAGAKEAYNGEDTVMGLITSGGKIAYAAPNDGRSVGPVFPALGLVPAIEQTAEDESHGDEISVEAIAQSNPDWLLVLDRDASFAPENRDASAVPADELIAGSEALQNVTAVQNGQIVYLDANFYLREDIQLYTELFTQLKDALSAS